MNVRRRNETNFASRAIETAAFLVAIAAAAVIVTEWGTAYERIKRINDAVAVETPQVNDALAGDVIRACHARGLHVSVSHRRGDYQITCRSEE